MARSRHPTLMEHHHPVGVLKGQVQVVEDDQHSSPVLRKSGGDGEEVVLMAHVQAGGGLVQEKEAGAFGLGLPHLAQDPGEMDPLLFSPRKRSVGPVPQGEGVDLQQGRLHDGPPGPLSFPLLMGNAPQSHHLPHRKGEGQGRFLGKHRPQPSQVMGSPGGEGASQEGDLSLGGGKLPGEHLEQTGFSRSVGPQKSHDLPGVDQDGNSVQDDLGVSFQTQVSAGEGLHPHLPSFRLNKARKKGVPSREVTMPMGTS